MDDPLNEIEGVIIRLCTAERPAQEDTLKTYFTTNASFKHPFCAVVNDREQIIRIYQWYKILSPRIDVTIDSTAFDGQNEILYANVSQTFKIWFILGYEAKVKLTTVLHLVSTQSNAAAKLCLPESGKWYIKSQEDLYQTDEFVKFVLPFFGIGSTVVGFWHYLATLACVYGAKYYMMIASFLIRIFRKRPEQHLISDEPNHAPASGEATADDQRRDSGRVEEVTGSTGAQADSSSAKKRPKADQIAKSPAMGEGALERKSNLGHKALR